MNNPILVGAISGSAITLFWIYMALNRIANVMEEMLQRLKERDNY